MFVVAIVFICITNGNMLYCFRRDIFPVKICRHLSKLQRNAQTHQWEFTKQLLDEAFGPVKVAGLLSGINTTPIGSGCCAQVRDCKKSF